MAALGFKPFLRSEIQAPIIVTFHAPASPRYDFKAFYDGAKKRGFTLPLAQWFRGPGRAWFEDNTASLSASDDLIDGRQVRQLMREHQQGRDHSARLWRILAFHVWRRDTLPQMRPPAARAHLATI